jgi:hypothetical protein
MSRRSLTRAFGAALLASLVACRLLVDSNSAQCASDGDCAGLFPGAGLACLGSTCVERASGADAGDGGPSCTSNAECMDLEAKASGGAAICVTGRCQPIRVEGVCLPQLLPFAKTGRSPLEYLRDDNVVVLGGFVPVKTGNPFEDPYVRAHNLALLELNANGGIPDGPKGALRPIVMVLCGAEPDLVDRGASHLIDDLKAPAVVANWISAADLPRFVAKAFAAGTFTMNPNDTTATLTIQDVKSLAWHLLGSAEDVALTYRPLVEMVEKYVRSRKGGTTDPIKVALVANRYPTNQEIANTIQYGPVVASGDGGTGAALARAVTFNGQSTAANATGGDPKFLFVAYDSPGLGGKPDYDAISSKVSAFDPDVVLAVTGDEIDRVVTKVETAMAAKDGGATNLPVWVLSVSNARPQPLRAYLEGPANELPEAKRQRFVGVQYAGSSRRSVRDEWFQRMETEYGADLADSTSFRATENFYDAIYWLGYGLFAAGPGADPTGNSFKLGIRRLLSGAEVFPGLESRRVAAYQTIRLGGNEATFIGALGPRDITPSTGAQFGQGAVYCYELDASKINVKYDTYRYNKQTGKLDKSDEFCFIGSGFP